MIAKTGNIDDPSTAWKIATVIVTAFMVISTLTTAVYYQKETNENTNNLPETWDFSIVPEKASKNEFKATAPDFSVLFNTNSAGSKYCELDTEYGSVRLSQSDILVNDEQRLSLSNIETSIDGPSIEYRDPQQDFFKVSYAVGLNGVRGTTTLAAPIPHAVELSVSSSVSYPSDFTVWTNGTRIGYMPLITNAPIEIKDDELDSVFLIMPPSLRDNHYTDGQTSLGQDFYSPILRTDQLFYEVSSLPGLMNIKIILDIDSIQPNMLQYPISIDLPISPVSNILVSVVDRNIELLTDAHLFNGGFLLVSDSTIYSKNKASGIISDVGTVVSLTNVSIKGSMADNRPGLSISGYLDMTGSTLTSTGTALRLATACDVSISSSVIDQCIKDAIDILGSKGNITIDDCSIRNIKGTGILVNDSEGDIKISSTTIDKTMNGLSASKSTVFIENCTFTEIDEIGIIIDSCQDGVTILDSKFIRNNASILCSASNLEFVYSEIDDCVSGIILEDSNATIEGSRFQTCNVGLTSQDSRISLLYSNLTDSTTGVFSEHDSLFIKGTSMDHIGTAASIISPTSLNGQDIFVNNCSSGIRIDSSSEGILSRIYANDNERALTLNDSHVIIRDSFIERNDEGICASNSDIILVADIFTENQLGISYRTPLRNGTIQDCLFHNNKVGAYVEDGHFTFENVDFSTNELWSLEANYTTLDIVGGTLSPNEFHPLVTWTTYWKTLNLKINNEDGSSTGTLTMTIYDSDGAIARDKNNVAYQNKQTTNGQYNNLDMIFYKQDDTGVKDFKTPHKIQLTHSGKMYETRIVMDADKSYTLIWNDTMCDFDDDGLPDKDLSGNRVEYLDEVVWMEAEYHSSCQQIEEITASNNISVYGNDLTDSYTFPEFQTGKYRLYLRSRGSEDGAKLTVTVKDKNNNVLLNGQQFVVGQYTYNWLITDLFTLNTIGVLKIQVTNSSDPGAVVYLDKLAVVKAQQTNGVLTNVRDGRVTDPLSPDTDVDLANDSYEVSIVGSYWFEAEQYATGPRYAEANASSSLAVAHPNNNQLILQMTLTSANYHFGSDIEVFVKARKAVQFPTVMKIYVQVGSGTPVEFLENLVEEYDWYATPEIDCPGAQSITIRVYDWSDPLLTDGTNYVIVDEIHIRDPYYDPEPIFYASNPLDFDTDSDNISDGSEIFGFFRMDEFEAESTHEFSSPLALIMPNAVRLEYFQVGDRAWFYLDITIGETGVYAIEPIWSIGILDGVVDADDAHRLLEVSLRTTLPPPNNIIYPDSTMESGFETTEGYGGEQLCGFTVQRVFYFLLQPGSYDINVTYNTTLAQTLNGQRFTIFVDKVLLSRSPLDPIDSDTDDDLALDGEEFSVNSFPLNQNSDNDAINDGEEYHEGIDGWVTSPISTDTDQDGITDYTEIHSNLGLDPTDPDTDEDGLPDGWIDGWMFSVEENRYVICNDFRDGWKQPWEGEDLDLDGVWDSMSMFWSYDDETGEATGGETNPVDEDSDDDTIPDGWELINRDVYVDELPCMLNPLSAFNGQLDYDSDGLTNAQEHDFDTNPYLADTDDDSIQDGRETKVGLRTSIAHGMYESISYSSATQNDWMIYDSNPCDLVLSNAYSYGSTVSSYTIQARQFDQGLETGDPAVSGQLDCEAHATGSLSTVTKEEMQGQGLYPISGDKMLKFAGSDNSNAYNSYESRKLYIFSPTLSIEVNTHLSFWIYVKTSPGGKNNIGIDGKLQSTYLSDATYEITDEDGKPLDITARGIPTGIWLKLDYNLSAANGQSLSFLCVKYDDSEDSDQGPFEAYFDDIRIYKEQTAPHQQVGTGVSVAHSMSDGSTIIFNSNTDKLYVVSNETEYTDTDDDGILEGPVYIFNRNLNPGQGVERSNETKSTYWQREALGGVNPSKPDSDSDGIPDGKEGRIILSDSHYPGNRVWDGDIDGDGLANAVDADSDGDTIPDLLEDLDGDGVFDPLQDETLAFFVDTDGDGTNDNLDIWPLDSDNDDLTGFPTHNLYYYFVTGSQERTYFGENFDDGFFNPDVDGDGVNDGVEDSDDDGVWDEDLETNALDADTDDDGLYDGYNILETYGTSGEFLRIEAEEKLTGSTGTTISDAGASGGEKVELGPDDYCDYEIVVEYDVGLIPGVYEVTARLQDYYTSSNNIDHNPKRMTLRLHVGTNWMILHANECHTVVDAPTPNGWTSEFVGVMNLTAEDTYTMRIDCGYVGDTNDGQLFYLDYLDIALVEHAGELSIHTDPLRGDTDGDKVLDGTEWGLGIPGMDQNPLQVTRQDWLTAPYKATIISGEGAYIADADWTTITDTLDPDTDGDGAQDGWADSDLDGVKDPGEIGEDHDLDGKMDAHESDPVWDRDTDDDGISDYQELLIGTYPDDHDSDDDMVFDGTEIGLGANDYVAGYTDLNANHFIFDHDAGATVTNPQNPNTDYTDQDHLLDGWDDIDEDGLFDPGTEVGEDTNHDGDIDSGESDPNDCDADDDLLGDDLDHWWGSGDTDGLLDGEEVCMYQTDPTKDDSDSDGINDKDEVDNKLNPNSADTDGDGLEDPYEVEWDSDSDGDGIINALDWDSDNDGLADGLEETCHTGDSLAVFDPETDFSDVLWTDSDGDEINDSVDEYPLDYDNDGLTGYPGFSGTEYWYACDMFLADTDGDTISDYDEVMGTYVYNSNPTLADTDSDDLTDSEEMLGWWLEFYDDVGNVIDTLHVTSSPVDTDTDDDGVIDDDEFGVSNPNTDDTDGDGLLDPDDDDNSIVEMIPPEITDVKLSMCCVKEGDRGRQYYAQGKIKVEDNVEIYCVYVTLLDTGKTYQLYDGDSDGWYTVNFSATKDQLANGFKMNFSVYDINGNGAYIVKEGKFKSDWEVAWEFMSGWLDAAIQLVREVAAAFLTFLVGPLIGGGIQGFIEGFLKGLIGDLTFFAQIPGMLWNIRDTVSGINQMIHNLGTCVREMINQTIQYAERVVPYKDDPPVDVGLMGNIIVRFFTGDWSYECTDRFLFDVAYVVLDIVGFLVQQIMCGGMMVLGKLGAYSKGIYAMSGITEGMNKISNILNEVKGIVQNTVNSATAATRAALRGMVKSANSAKRIILGTSDEVIEKVVQGGAKTAKAVDKTVVEMGPGITKEIQENFDTIGKIKGILEDEGRATPVIWDAKTYKRLGEIVKICGPDSPEMKDLIALVEKTGTKYKNTDRLVRTLGGALANPDTPAWTISGYWAEIKWAATHDPLPGNYIICCYDKSTSWVDGVFGRPTWGNKKCRVQIDFAEYNPSTERYIFNELKDGEHLTPADINRKHMLDRRVAFRALDNHVDEIRYYFTHQPPPETIALFNSYNPHIEYTIMGS